MAHSAALRRATTAPMPGSPLDPGYDAADLRLHFDYSSDGEDGLKEISFGEYLVEHAVVDRFELFRALQLQDRVRGVRIGECVAALGYAPIGVIERMYAAFSGIDTLTVERPASRGSPRR